MKTASLTESQLARIEWATAQLNLLAPAAAINSLAPIATRIAERIRTHLEAEFPRTPAEDKAAVQMAKDAEERIAEKGPQMWRELHQWALAFPATATKREREDGMRWLERFIIRLQNEVCPRCAKHMRQYIAAQEVDWTDLFRWTWNFHNWVNVSRRAAEMSYEKARAEYAPAA